MARRNFLLKLAYDGGDFKGWQRLSGAARAAGRTVQGEVEACLGKALGRSARERGGERSGEHPATPEAIEIIGAGRTDAGVHAEGQAASFHAFTPLEGDDLKNAINEVFPGDLACVSCVEVDPRFHARLHAKGKIYRYRFLTSNVGDPFLSRFSLRVPVALDLGAMSAAAAALVGEHDFRAVSNAKGDDTKRRLDEARVEAHGKLVDLVFVGPGFIYNQVRIMAGLVLEAGKGSLPPERVPAILEGRDRGAAPGALAPQGLCLVDVLYDRL